MTIRRLPKPKKHWADPTFSQEEVDKYEQSLVDKAIEEAGTPYLKDVIVYLMENCHPEGVHKEVGSKKIWNTHLQILIACHFELEKAKTLELTAGRVVKKYPIWNKLISLDKKTTHGMSGLIKHRLKGSKSKLYPSESKIYLNNPELITKAIARELQRLGIRTESV
jgi:hypothetical protein